MYITPKNPQASSSGTDSFSHTHNDHVRDRFMGRCVLFEKSTDDQSIRPGAPSSPSNA